MIEPDEIIKRLGLQPHPNEGGFFAESFRSDEILSRDDLPGRYSSQRAFSTCIYYMLTRETFSALHRLQSDEIFHFYLGDPVSMLLLYPDGNSEIITLGHDIIDGQKLQAVVPKNVWQGSFLNEGGRFALMGTTMAPGFDFEDYEHADKNELIRKYPDRSSLIERLTKEQD
ncbi:MAG TPA: cupin domain-containing protein [candidate division Zixibacteria bacterium]|nr:cupin domain-containing protein [candidate division Zixibacteria bacterium]